MRYYKIFLALKVHHLLSFFSRSEYENTLVGFGVISVLISRHSFWAHTLWHPPVADLTQACTFFLLQRYVSSAKIFYMLFLFSVKGLLLGPELKSGN